jgi:hypothetical protein
MSALCPRHLIPCSISALPCKTIGGALAGREIAISNPDTGMMASAHWGPLHRGRAEYGSQPVM